LRIVRNKKGQFILIAVMMIAIMIVSIGAVLHSAGTYYRYEQWEEYITLVEHIKFNTIRLVEISLANFTTSGNNSTGMHAYALRMYNSTLKDNLNQWQNDLRTAYPGYGVILAYELADGTNIEYFQGFASKWNETVSYSTANATFALDITSVGLTGFRFMATPLLSLAIVNASASTDEIIVAVTQEDEMPVLKLERDNFQVDGLNVTNVASSYDPDYVLVYTIKCDSNIPAAVTVRVRDHRGIQVIARSG